MHFYQELKHEMEQSMEYELKHEIEFELLHVNDLLFELLLMLMW